MAYGTLKVDNITYTSAGVDATTTVSGLVEGNFPNITITGTISGATITGNTGQFTTITAVTGIFTNTLSGAVVTVPSGSAASPTVIFTGDADTGLYSPGANQVAISTSGTGRLFINESGLVGLGTSSPANGRLNVSATTNQITLDTTSTTADGRLDIGHFSNGTFIGTYAGTNADADKIRFGTSGATRVTIDSSGRVGVGTTSPGSLIHTAGNANAAQFDSSTGVYLTLKYNGTAVGYIGSANQAYTGGGTGNISIAGGAGSSITFATTDTERARIDSSGRLLVGTSSSTAVSDGEEPFLQVKGTDSRGGLSLARFSNDGNACGLYIGKSRGTSIGSNTIVASGDELGRITFAGSDGTDLNTQAASIKAEVDGTPGANDMPGRIVLSTTASGAASPTERMRISQNGVVTIQNGAVAVIDVLADGATITPDLASGCNFSVSISGNRTLANPTNITAGQTGSIFITQGTGSNTLSWGSYWDFPGGTAPTLSTTSGAVDRVDYIVRTTTSIQTVFTANYS